MQLIVKCPFCGLVWQLDGDAADRRLVCKGCQKRFKVPDSSESLAGPRIITTDEGAVYIDAKGRIFG